MRFQPAQQTLHRRIHVAQPQVVIGDHDVGWGAFHHRYDAPNFVTLLGHLVPVNFGGLQNGVNALYGLVQRLRQVTQFVAGQHPGLVGQIATSQTVREIKHFPDTGPDAASERERQAQQRNQQSDNDEDLAKERTEKPIVHLIHINAGGQHPVPGGKFPGVGDLEDRLTGTRPWPFIGDEAAAIAAGGVDQVGGHRRQRISVAAATRVRVFQFRARSMQQKALIRIENGEVEILIAHIAQRFDGQALGLLAG